VHILRDVRGRSARQRLPQLRRRVRPRPIRPSRNWNGDNFLGKDPASAKVRHRPVDAAAHAAFAAKIRDVLPEKR
jgi:hypothetical protein